MKIGKRILAALLGAAVTPLLTGAVSPSCPSGPKSIVAPPFEQSCQNHCSFGANAGEIVGPAVLKSGDASGYEVAAIYFGHQNWGGCVGMVSAMASAYEGLTEAERERVFLLSVGRSEYSALDSNFCRGFAACADEGGAPWWTALGASQRDVVFYLRADPTRDDSWEFYCHYSMNTHRAEFGDTIREMLAVTEEAAAAAAAAAELEVEMEIEAADEEVEAAVTTDVLDELDTDLDLELELIGNETTIEPEDEMEPPILSPVSLLDSDSSPLASSLSSSSSSSPSRVAITANAMTLVAGASILTGFVL